MPSPTPDLLKAALALVNVDLVTVKAMQEPSCVRIRETGGVGTVAATLDEGDDFQELFDEPVGTSETSDSMEAPMDQTTAVDGVDTEPIIQAYG